MMSKVSLYTFTVEIERMQYSGRIPARSWAEAQVLVPFAVVDGELIAEFDYDIEEMTMPLMYMPSRYQVH